ncbi:MAG: hypothetical protein U0795_18375 [Pirellulales bacterium]
MNGSTRRNWLKMAAPAAMSLFPGWVSSTNRAMAAEPPDADRQVDWLSEVQRPPDPWPADAPELAPIQADVDVDAGRQQLARWLNDRPALRNWWLNRLGWQDPGKRPPTWRVLESDRVEGVIRQRIEYETHPNWIVEAYLLYPERIVDRRPGYVVFHSTVDSSIRQPAGLADREPLAFGLQLARRGAITLAPRNFLWPTNDRLDAQSRADEWLRQHPGSTGMAKMLIDAQLALNLLASLPMVEPGSLGAIGHSLGAKEVLYLAAFDERVRVSVSSEGGVGLGFSNWADDWYLGPRFLEASGTHDHHELLALAAPRAFLLIGGDSADGARSWPYIDRALDVYGMYRAAGRVGSMPLGLWNHGQGHAVPAESLPRIWEWLETYVR